MSDDNEVHKALGDHGARLNNLEDNHRSLDGKISAVDERQRRDIRRGLIAVVSVLFGLVVGVFRWIGERFADMLQ